MATEGEIIGSQAFKAINMLIDQKAAYVVDMVNSLPETFAEATTNLRFKDRIGTRTHAEGGDEIVLATSMERLDHIVWKIGEIKKQREEISDLIRFKLRLLNDYDFTHGDASEQEALFGSSEGTA